MKQTKRRLVVLLLTAMFGEATGLGQSLPVRTDLYGDPLPIGAVARLGTVRFRMRGLIYACAYAPDGKTLAASADNIVYFFDVATGKPIRQLRGEAGRTHLEVHKEPGVALLSLTYFC